MVIDFGSAILPVAQRIPITSLRGVTSGYFPLEYRFADDVAPFLLDAWAVGVTLLELMWHHHHYFGGWMEEESRLHHFHNQINRYNRYNRSGLQDDELMRLIRQLLAQNPEDRINISRALTILTSILIPH